MNILSILISIFSIKNMLIMCGGILIGIIGGALPGISSTMCVSLLLPFTFAMSPETGILMLMAIYTSAVYGGSISAILINTPGTGSSAATALDGYPLTSQGRGGQALRISTLASAIGGVISGIALLVLAPPLSQISLLFGPSEYMLLAVIGLTAVVTLAADSLFKGILSAIFGLFLTTVGVDFSIGYPRFTFGIIELDSGISFIPALIGLFALSEVLKLCERPRESNIDVANFKSDRIFPSMEETRGLWGTIARSSIIGVIIGILPGAGAEIGSWISYNTAKSLSKEKEKFGKGSLEGIAASESANNAVTGGALIPLLTLGIPGSSVAAVILGGLLIHGLVPGRELFTTHARMTYTVIIGFIIANILIALFGFILAKPFSQVAKLPKKYLTPMIVIFCFIGSFALNNSMFDIVIMIIFGVIGYIIQKAGFHPAPIVLAMVLGQMLESRYLQTFTVSNGKVISYIMTRPISIVLIIIAIIFLVSPMFFKNIKRG